MLAVRSKFVKMSVKVVVCLSFLVFVFGQDIPVDEEHQKVMMRCAKESGVTNEEVHEFAKELKDPTPEIKNFFLCVSESLKIFDGVNWNKEEVKKVVKDENKMPAVEECLAKENKSLEPRERNFEVVVCALEKEAFL